MGFNDAGDSVGTKLNDLNFCGTRSFKVLLDSDGQSQEIPWITVEQTGTAQYKMKFSPASKDLIGNHTLNLVIQS